MKKTIALLLALTTVLCLALAGCGQKTAESSTMENTLETLNDTYWIASHIQSSDESDLTPIDDECSNGIALVFSDGKVTLIDCDGIQLRAVEYQYSDKTITFDGLDLTDGYASIDGDGMRLYSSFGTSWVMVQTDVDTANVYISRLLDDSGERFVIGEINDTDDTSSAPLGNDETIPDGAAYEEAMQQAQSSSAAEKATASNVKFSKYEEIETDSEGYKVRKVLTISPWISENDAALLETAWSEVGKGNAFPSPSSLGFMGNSVSNYYKAHIDYDEIYYAVGTLEVYNETEGWDISESNPRSFYISIGGANQYMTMQMMYSNGTKNYYDVFAPTNGCFGTKGGGWSPIYISMKSNKWGAVPFVIGFVVDKTPNHPNGDPSIEDCVFTFGDNEFTLVP